MDPVSRRKSREELPPITENFLDVERVFKAKNPRLAASMPKFVFSFLKKIIHQDEMNKFIWENRDYWGLDYTEAILRDFGITTVVTNNHYFPERGRFLIASNHPLGGMDGIGLIHESGKIRKDIVFPVNDLLMNLPNLYELFIPVNKHGSNAENIRLFNDTFASDTTILYFPAGLVSRKIKGVIKDMEWKKTFITRARTYKRDIVPVYISGRNSNFFYNLANLRKRLGIKANIEMLFLVNEFYKYRGKTITITFGKPVPFTKFDNSKTDQQWAALMREHVYKLALDPEQEFEY